MLGANGVAPFPWQQYYKNSHKTVLDFLKYVLYMFLCDLEFVGDESVAVSQAHTGKGASLRAPVRGI
jgi:hypothetical protein